MKYKNFAVLHVKREIQHIWISSLICITAKTSCCTSTRAQVSEIELSNSYLTMLLNFVLLKFPRISRPRPVLPTLISEKCKFQTPKREEQTEHFWFHDDVSYIFVERKFTVLHMKLKI